MSSHAKKMVLVPPEVLLTLQQQKPVTSQKATQSTVDELDETMSKILQSKAPPDVKRTMYQQAFQTFNKLVEKMDEPVKLQLMTEKAEHLAQVPVSTTEPESVVHPESEEVKQPEPEIKDSPDKLPPVLTHHQVKSMADPLLDFLKSVKRISWNQQSEILIDGQRIPGSNIKELVTEVVRKTQSRHAIKGIDEFLNVLREVNVPLDLIGLARKPFFIGDGSQHKSQTGNRRPVEMKLLKKWRPYPNL